MHKGMLPMPMDRAQMLDAFLDVLSSNGIRLRDPSAIKIDGDKHRAIVDGDKKSNLVYQIFPDDRPAGWFDYYKGGIADTFVLGNDNGPLSDQERARLQQQMQAEKQRRQLETQRRYDERAEYIRQLWASAKPVATHPYLTRKAITTAAGIRQLDTVNMAEFMSDPENQTTIRNALLIPVFRLTDGKAVMEAAQIIDHAGKKLFAKGARMRGNCHPIRGDRKDYVVITEGYATGKAINAVTGQTVMVCMFAGNMAATAQLVRDYLTDGRPIIYAPDNDWALPLQGKANPGMDGANEAADIVPGQIIAPQFPETADHGHTDWDDWLRHYGTADQMLALFEPPASEAENDNEPTIDSDDEFSDEDPLLDAPFRMLGHDGERYYYLDNEGLRVRAIPAAGHTKAQLVVIADKLFWEMRYPVRNKDGVIIGANWDRAGNDLLRAQHRIGIYDTTRLRGRGAWFDDGRSVLHVGNSLIVDGEQVDIRNFPTTYIYEAGSRLDFTGGKQPLTSSQISRLTKLSRMLSWDRLVYSDLAIGWCVAAVICGSLPWRPHIWITGPSGSGKSWVYDNILKWLVGEDWAMLAQSATTEAGIRQTMKRDARPVIFDEAEGEDKSARQRMQNVLELVRQASSETGAPIIKGSRDGDAVEYRIRSCFAFSSINVLASLAADISRTSVLSLHANTRPGASDEFEQIRKTRTELMTPTFCQQFRATAVNLIPRIIAGHEIMTRVAAEKFGRRREGDQIGTLMVCFWALTAPASETMTIDRARKFLDQYDWPTNMTPAKEDMDENKLLNTILSAMVRTEVATPGGGSTTVSRTVAELAEVAGGFRAYDEENRMLDGKAAEAVLRRHGLGTLGGMLHISHSHPAIKRMLDGTPWEGKWATVIDRVAGRVQKDGFKFAGTITRATAVPIKQAPPPDDSDSAF